jgi:hypothetical protein
MPYGGLEVDEPVAPEMLLLGARADDDLAVEDDDERVLVDLVVGEALALGQEKQDDPVGVVIGAQDAGRVRLNRFGVQLPEVHGRL